MTNPNDHIRETRFKLNEFRARIDSLIAARALLIASNDLCTVHVGDLNEMVEQLEDDYVLMSNNLNAYIARHSL